MVKAKLRTAKAKARALEFAEVEKLRKREEKYKRKRDLDKAIEAFVKKWNKKRDREEAAKEAKRAKNTPSNCALADRSGGKDKKLQQLRRRMRKRRRARDKARKYRNERFKLGAHRFKFKDLNVRVTNYMPTKQSGWEGSIRLTICFDGKWQGSTFKRVTLKMVARSKMAKQIAKRLPRKR